MTLKLNRDAKVTWALTGRHLVRPADDDDFGTHIGVYDLLMYVYKFQAIKRTLDKNKKFW